MSYFPIKYHNSYANQIQGRDRDAMVDRMSLDNPDLYSYARYVCCLLDEWGLEHGDDARPGILLAIALGSTHACSVYLEDEDRWPIGIVLRW